MKNYGDAGSCQVDINCVEGDDWQDEKKGVVLIIIDEIFAGTGSLVNNVAQNGRLLILTVKHIAPDCSASEGECSFQFIWNYELSQCNPSPLPTEPSRTLRTTFGGTILANTEDFETDMMLLEIEPDIHDSPFDLDEPFNDIYFNGWDRTGISIQGGVGIHHPRVDVKKISTHNIVPYDGIVFNDEHWRVDWMSTTNGFSVTESGSSGSPLFDNNGRIIGQLHGGSGINCEDPANDPREYGKFHLSWTYDTPNNRQLAHWLNPWNTNITRLNGGYLDLCVEDRTIDFIITNNALIQANNSITTNSEILIPTSVEMRANGFIKMIDGFKAGNEFKAYIHPCERRVLPPLKNNQQYENIEEEATIYDLNKLTIIYPNPTTNEITIESPKQYQLRIFNLMGQEVGQLNGKQDKTVYDMTSFEAGIYIFQVRYEDGTVESLKVLKQ